MTPNSFTFNGINFLDKWGVKCIKHDVLAPQKRKNALMIPKRNGVYIQSGKYYDERVVTVTCVLPQKFTPLDIREISYDLSDRRSLYFWDEPELHYDAELYDPTDVAIWPAYHGMEIELQFVAFPFALSDRKTFPIRSGVNQIMIGEQSLYGGTYETPCVITLVNNSSTTAQTIKITAIKRSVN